MKKSICFAYFADDKFIGWYSDSFGTITKNCPKVYTDLETMKPIIEKNFNYKIEKLKEERDETAELIGNINPLGGLLIQQTVDSDKSKIGNSDNVELRVVECPIYDGPDPDFNEKEYKEKVKAQRDLMEKEGIFDIPAPSKERSDALNAFYEREGKVKCDNWIYADYNKVKEWAANEPKDFIFIIKRKKA